MFSDVFEMYGHHLKIRFHINIQVSSLRSCMRTITWSCCLSLLALPRCPPTTLFCPPARPTAQRNCRGAHPPRAAPQQSFKDLQAVTLEWTRESSVCKQANASSFRCGSSDSISSLPPVPPPSSGPQSPRSVSSLQACIQKSEQCSPQGLVGADLGRGVKESSL